MISELIFIGKIKSLFVYFEAQLCTIEFIYFCKSFYNNIQNKGYSLPLPYAFLQWLAEASCSGMLAPPLSFVFFGNSWEVTTIDAGCAKSVARPILVNNQLLF